MDSEVNKVDLEVVPHKAASQAAVVHLKVHSVVVHNTEATPVVVHNLDSVKLNLVQHSVQLPFYLMRMLTMVMAATDSVMV